MSAPFTISRLLNAPRQLVWEVYSQPEHLPNWFGPKGSTMPHSELNFRVGGSFLYSMKTGEGMELWGKWLFQEISAPEKMVLIQHFSDPQGGVTRNPWNPLWPLYTHSTTTLTEQGSNKTLLTLEWSAYQASPEEIAVFEAGYASMTEGWGGTIDGLESYLSLLTSNP